MATTKGAIGVGHSWKVSDYPNLAIGAMGYIYILNEDQQQFFPYVASSLKHAVALQRLYLGNINWRGLSFNDFNIKNVAADLQQFIIIGGENLIPTFPDYYATFTVITLFRVENSNLTAGVLNTFLDDFDAITLAGLGSANGSGKILDLTGGTNGIPTNTAAITAIEGRGWTVQVNS